MKYLLFASSIALGLALQPVNAQDTNTQETLHAPTNRVGEMVPTMTGPEGKEKAASKDATAEQKAESVHPPTNRVGKQVPTMKSADNEDDQKKSKTYYYGDDEKSSTN